MTPERWSRIREIFAAAMETPEAERPRFLESACAGDAELRAEVEWVLAGNQEPSWQSPAVKLFPAAAELAPGDTVAHYRIEAKLGEGGMGVVYRASDSRLRRNVALKFVKAEFSSRNQREARAVAALNHPNICTLYDVGPNYLVMELIEGPTLAQRLAKGVIPLAETLGIARQIAEALEAAHEKGVVHRDLKPANIKLTSDGAVKVLDFGLAKAQELTAGSAEASHTQSFSATQPGTILGTAAYMSPEQASGMPVDRRADIWSFGVVLWEMLMARRLFGGETTTHTLAQVLHRPIEFEQLPRETPAVIRGLLRRCLDRNVKNRLRDIGEARIAIEAALQPEEPAAPLPKTRSPFTWIAAVWVLPLALGGLAVLSALYITRPEPLDLSTYKFTPVATDAEREQLSSWSPDGKMIAYLKVIDGQNQVMVRNLSTPLPTQLTRLSPGVWATAPFFSPDGERVYYIASGALWSVAAVGGEPREVLRAQMYAAALSPDGRTIAFWRLYEEAGKQQCSVWISSPPGAPPRKYEPSPFQADLSVPDFLRFSPDGSHIGLSGFRAQGEGWVWSLPWPDGPKAQPRQLFSRLAFLAPPPFDWMPDSRHICFSRDDSLWLGDTGAEKPQRLTASAIGVATEPSVSPGGDRVLFTAGMFDLDIVDLPLDGSPPRPLLATARSESSPSWSAAGDLMAFITDRSGESEIWLRNLSGNWERPVVRQSDFPQDPGRALNGAALSPDGTRIAFERHGRLWVSPATGGRASQLVAGGEYEFPGPSWSPDSSSIAYIASIGGKWHVAVTRVGSQQPQFIVPDTAVQCASPPVWSPDGRWIACGGYDQTILLVAPDGKQRRKLPSPVRALPQRFLVVWSRDSGTIYLASSRTAKARLDAIDVRTESSRTVAEYAGGLTFSTRANYSLFGSLSRDGKSFATTVLNVRSDLWMLEGFPRPRRRWF